MAVSLALAKVERVSIYDRAIVSFCEGGYAGAPVRVWLCVRRGHAGCNAACLGTRDAHKEGPLIQVYVVCR